MNIFDDVSMSLSDVLPGTLVSSSPVVGEVIQKDINKSLISKSLSRGSPGNPPIQYAFLYFGMINSNSLLVQGQVMKSQCRDKGKTGDPPLRLPILYARCLLHTQPRPSNEISRGVRVFSRLDYPECNHIDEFSPVIVFGDVRNINRFAVATGGFSDIYLGQ